MTALKMDFCYRQGNALVFERNVRLVRGISIFTLKGECIYNCDCPLEKFKVGGLNGKYMVVVNIFGGDCITILWKVNN